MSTKYAKTGTVNAGSRAPVNITVEEDAKPLLSGYFRFVSRHTVELTADDGSKSLLFLGKSYSYSVVAPSIDTLAGFIGDEPEKVDGDDNDDNNEPEGEKLDAAPVDAANASTGALDP